MDTHVTANVVATARIVSHEDRHMVSKWIGEGRGGRCSSRAVASGEEQADENEGHGVKQKRAERGRGSEGSSDARGLSCRLHIGESEALYRGHQVGSPNRVSTTVRHTSPISTSVLQPALTHQRRQHFSHLRVRRRRCRPSPASQLALRGKDKHGMYRSDARALGAIERNAREGQVRCTGALGKTSRARCSRPKVITGELSNTRKRACDRPKADLPADNRDAEVA